MARRERPADTGGYDTHDIDGYEVLVGQSAKDNDRLSLKVANPQDVWLHVGGGHAPAATSLYGPRRGGEVPRHVVKKAAELAVRHSKAKNATGKVDVHVCRACDVTKPRGAKPGSVQLRRYESVKVYAGS